LFDREPKTAHEINATVMALKKALIERALSGEMNHYLGYLPAGRPNLKRGATSATAQEPRRYTPATARCALIFHATASPALSLS